MIYAFSAKKEFPKLVFGVPRETFPNERRVAASPDSVKALVKDGHKVLIEAGAGVDASFSDAAYTTSGATLVNKAEEVFNQSDVVLKVR